VSPILRYGCGVLAPFELKGDGLDNNFFHICEKSIIEQVNNKLCINIGDK
jgi:hypothetical protein